MKKKPENSIFATPERIKEVQGEIRELEIMLTEDSHRGQPKISDVDGVKAEIIKKQQYIERHAPAKFRGANANRAYKRAKELERIIKENMPKSSLYGQQYPKGADSHLKQQKFDEAVRQQMHFQSDPKLKQAQLEYKHLMARLDPGDPTVRNIERLRSQR